MTCDEDAGEQSSEEGQGAVEHLHQGPGTQPATALRAKAEGGPQGKTHKASPRPQTKRSRGAMGGAKSKQKGAAEKSSKGQTTVLHFFAKVNKA